MKNIRMITIDEKWVARVAYFLNAILFVELRVEYIFLLLEFMGVRYNKRQISRWFKNWQEEKRVPGAMAKKVFMDYLNEQIKTHGLGRTELNMRVLLEKKFGRFSGNLDDYDVFASNDEFIDRESVQSALGFYQKIMPIMTLILCNDFIDNIERLDKMIEPDDPMG